MAVAIWMIRRTEYFGGRVGAIRADPELAEFLVKRGDAQLITRGVKLQKIDKAAPPEKTNGKGKKGSKAKAPPPVDDTTKTDVPADPPAPEPAPADDD